MMDEMLPGFVLSALNFLARLLVLASGSTRDLRPAGRPIFAIAGMSDGALLRAAA